MRAPLGPMILSALLVALMIGYGMEGVRERAPDESTEVADDDAPSADAQRGAARSPVTNLTLVASLPLNATNADVWYHNGVAYVGTWSGPCSGEGVKVVDVSDAARPSLLTTLAAYANTSAEDFEVHAVDTARFRGDLMAVGLQSCGPGGKTGLDLWDVTNASAPLHLAYFHTGSGGIHELSVTDRPGDGRVLALVAVPYAEPTGAGGDFKIIDITDPYLPLRVADWGIVRERGAIPGAGLGAMPTDYDHSVGPSPNGNTAYVSYWDAGVQIIDIRDPAAPHFIGNTSYPADAEGNAHSIAVSPERKLLIQADEDFSFRTVAIRIHAPDTLAGQMDVVEATIGPTVNETVSANATLVDVGRGCFNDTYPVHPSGAIVLADRGDCTFAEKIQKAQDAGALAVLVVNNEPGPATQMGGDGTNVTLPSAMLSQANGTALREAVANGTVAVEFSLDTARYDVWGGVRLFDISDPARPVEVGTYLTPHGANEPVGRSEGRYSVHNPILLDPDTLVVSWFGDGVRVIDIAQPSAPREIASWVPPTLVNETGVERVANVWGVVADGDTLYASDMDFGLYILRVGRA